MKRRFFDSRLLWNRNPERSSSELNRFRRQSHYSQKCVTWAVLLPPFHIWHYFWDLAKRVTGCFSLPLMYPCHLVHLCFLNREVNWHFNPVCRVFHQLIYDEQLFLLCKKDVVEKCRKLFYPAGNGACTASLLSWPCSLSYESTALTFSHTSCPWQSYEDLGDLNVPSSGWGSLF